MSARNLRHLAVLVSEVIIVLVVFRSMYQFPIAMGFHGVRVMGFPTIRSFRRMPLCTENRFFHQYLDCRRVKYGNRRNYFVCTTYPMYKALSAAQCMVNNDGNERNRQPKRSYESIMNEVYQLASSSSISASCYSTASSSSSTVIGKDDHSDRTLINEKLVIMQSSEFVTHVVVTCTEGLTLRETLMESILYASKFTSSKKSFTDKDFCYQGMNQQNKTISTTHVPTPEELLTLGSIWYLPPNSPRDPSLGKKPIRCLDSKDNVNTSPIKAPQLDDVLNCGSYLRVHHNPRRFPAFHNFDWDSNFEDGSLYFSQSLDTERDTNIEKLPGVIIDEDEDLGFRIIMKPESIPVHATVDNSVENVAIGVQRSLLKRRGCTLEDLRKQLKSEEESHSQKVQKNSQRYDPLIYVSTPQRLDHDTAGLLVVATKKEFAAYFAKLLRRKTSDQLIRNVNSDKSISPNDSISKLYKCAVCVISNQGSSMYAEIERLRTLSSSSELIVHYLEPSLRAPKNFEIKPGNSTWAQCLLSIVDVGDVLPLGNLKTSKNFSSKLWGACGEIY